MPSRNGSSCGLCHCTRYCSCYVIVFSHAHTRFKSQPEDLRDLRPGGIQPRLC